MTTHRVTLILRVAFEKYLAFSATNSSSSVFAVIDTVAKEQTGGFDSTGYFGVNVDESGIYVLRDNLLVKIHPVTGEQTPLVTTSEKYCIMLPIICRRWLFQMNQLCSLTPIQN